MTSQHSVRKSLPQPLCTSVFTLPSALLCFDNLSSRNSPRKSYSVGLHKCMYAGTQTHTWADGAESGGSPVGDNHQRVTTGGAGAVITAAGRRQDAGGGLVMGGNLSDLPSQRPDALTFTFPAHRFPLLVYLGLCVNPVGRCLEQTSPDASDRKTSFLI